MIIIIIIVNCFFLIVFVRLPTPTLLCHSLRRSDDSSSGPSCLTIGVLATYPRNTRLHHVHPPTDSFDKESAPHLFS